MSAGRKTRRKSQKKIPSQPRETKGININLMGRELEAAPDGEERQLVAPVDFIKQEK
jgi:hypothetical protein